MKPKVVDPWSLTVTSCMIWDNWAQQAYDVFKAVLSRPRFGLTLAKEGVMPSGRKIAYFRHDGSSDLVAVTVTAGRFNCAVQAFEVGNLDSWIKQGRFNFQTHFNKSTSFPMRKEALKLAKKISQKEVFDVMHS